MIYFKSFIKIFRAQLLKILIYIGVFVIVCGINLQSTKKKSESQYSNENINVAVIDYDHSTFSSNLKDYIKENMNLIEIKKTKEGIEDALFHRAAEYIVIIPKNFQNDLLSFKNVTLESREVPASSSAVFAKELINQYVSVFCDYAKLQDGIEVEELLKQTNETMKKSSNVSLISNETKENTMSEEMLDFGAYIILSCVIWGVSEMISVYFNKKIEERTSVSPFRPMKSNLLLMLYSLLFGMIIWMSVFAIYVVFLKDKLMSVTGIYLAINQFAIMFVGIGIAFTISVLFKSKNARGALSNTIGLGLSFISGVFVPLEYISKDICKLALFTPTYWFVNANEKITDLPRGINQAKEVLKCCGIQLLFAIAITIVGMLIKKQQLQKQILDKKPL